MVQTEQSLITFYRDSSNESLYHIEIRDAQRASRDYYSLKRFQYESTIPADEGSLIVQENTVLIAPHNKMLNLINGVWYLNDFVSTTPVISVSSERVEEVVNDVFIKPVGSLVVTKFTPGTTTTLLNTKINVGTTSVEFNISPGDPIYSLTSELDRIKTYAKTIYSKILEGLGETPPAVFSVEPGDTVTVSYGTATLKVTYLESRGLVNEPGLSSLTLAGVDFEYQVAEAITPIPIEITTVSQVGIVDVRVSTKDIGEGRGNYVIVAGLANQLAQQTDYWYKARYVYRDGHKTATCFPVFASTNNTKRLNVIRIESSVDLDGTLADIEIFRKTGSGDYYLIERLRNPVPQPDGYVEYIDDGKLDQALLDEQLYIWSSVHQTHAITRDRYVRANLNYQSRENEIEANWRIETTEDTDTLPPNTSIELISRNRFLDGLQSFHKKNDQVSIPYDVEFIRSYKGSPVLRSRNSDSHEVGWYYRYKALDPVQSLTIYSDRLSNLNTPYYSATQDPDRLPVNPTNPSFFIGYRYLYRGLDNQFYFADTNKGEEDTLGIQYKIQVVDPATNAPISGTPEYVKVVRNIYPEISGRGAILANEFVYRRIGETLAWEFVDFESLRELILNTDVTLTLTQYSGGSNIQADNLRGIEVKVTDIVDNSVAYSRTLHGVYNGVIGFANGDNGQVGRMYLTVETGTDLDRVEDMFSIILNIPYLFQYNDTSITTANRYRMVNTRPPTLPDNVVLYLGKDTEEFYPGIERVEENNAVYWKLKESNIYETFVGINDLDNYQQDFPNQLIWSEPKLLGTNISGNRTFTFTNVLNIQTDYGAIIRIEPLGNRLIVFTERGVAVVMVGEQLTQTPSNQTFVQGINYLNSPVWLLKNIEPVQLGTIKQYQNNLIFSDGVDVYRLGDQIENISNGAINLGEIRPNFTGYPSTQNRVATPAIMWATIDPKNREYRISNGRKTYCYNFDMGGWTGPHTYAELINTTFGDRSFGVVDSELIEHNIGNTRSEKEYGPDGEYETIIESTSNDTGDALTTKLFRKFYIEQDGSSTFEYSKTGDDFVSVDLDSARTVSGLKHVGVNSSNQNSRYMFWRFVTKAQDFLLKLVSFEYTPRNRR